MPYLAGAIVGAVFWSAFIRGPFAISKWLCSPFGNPSRLAMAVALIISYGASFLILLESFQAVADLFGAGTWNASYPDRKVFGREFGASSIFGYFLLLIFLRLEQLRTAGKRDATVERGGSETRAGQQ
jgi:hypothetical protein